MYRKNLKYVEWEETFLQDQLKIRLLNCRLYIPLHKISYVLNIT